MATAFLLRRDAAESVVSAPPAPVAPRRAPVAAVLAGTDAGHDVCIVRHGSLGIDAAPLEARFQSVIRGASNRELLEIYVKNGASSAWSVRRDVLALKDDGGRPIAVEVPPDGATGLGAASTMTLEPGASLRWVVGVPQGVVWRGGGCLFGEITLVSADAVVSDLAAWRTEAGRGIRDALVGNPLPKLVR